MPLAIQKSRASRLAPTPSSAPQRALRASYPDLVPGPELTLDVVCSGITRITVTVVVIMFELTGALTYILPTMVRSASDSRTRTSRSPTTKQIVVMVTKAVSDQFGGGGIADQMIRFNGYPLLENHDHAFGVPGKSGLLDEAMHKVLTG